MPAGRGKGGVLGDLSKEISKEIQEKLTARPASHLSPNDMTTIALHMENKRWMALFEAVRDIPGLTQAGRDALMPGYKIMYQGINRKIKFTQAILKTFNDLFQTLLTIPEEVITHFKEVITYYKGSEIDIVMTVVELHKSLKDMMQDDVQHTPMIAFNSERNRTSIILTRSN